MTTENILLIVLLVAATGACIAAVWVSREAVLTLRELRSFTDETRERLLPLLEKADVTIDAANIELLRLDAAITSFEDAGARISAASATISEVVQTPAEIVTGVADKVRKAWKDRRHEAEAHKAQRQSSDEAPAEARPAEATDHEPEDHPPILDTEPAAEDS